jgi:hypothetical protein
MGKGSSSPGTQYSEVQQTTSNLPEYAQPYYEDLLARTGYETSTPYQSYQGQRLAYFSPMEEEAMARFGQLGLSGDSPEMRQAGSIAQGIGTGSLNTGIGALGYYPQYYAQAPQGGYNPQQRYSGYQAGQYQMPGMDFSDYTSGYVPGQYTPGGYDPGQRDVGFDPEQREVEFEAMSRESGYDPESRAMGFEAGSLADSEAMAKYMDPYFQNVLDIEKREAARQADIRRKVTGLDAAGIGSLGGYREAIEQAETERNLMQNMADIQTRGTQAAYQSAQQAFEADRQGRGMEEQFGQSQFGLNQQAQQQAEAFQQSQFGLNAEQQQAREAFMQSQFGQNQEQRQKHEEYMQSQFGMNEQARQRAEELLQSGFEMNEAVKIAGEEMAQSAFGMNTEAKVRMQELMLQGFTANEAARQVQEQLGQSQFAQSQQAQQFQAQLEFEQYNAYEQARQQATAFGLSAAEANMQGQIAAAQVRSQLEQNRLSAAGMLGDYASQQQGMELERLRSMQSAGMMQRGLMQQGLDMGYQDFMRQQAFPREQLAFYNAMLQGLPITPGQTTATYGPQPSTGQQLLGSGIAGLGLYNAMQGGYGGGYGG